ncbi:MAG TPA: J domain-containing protein [Clostridia bacterium]|nr:J domain-containing protein [Clostridia bacterium]
MAAVPDPYAVLGLPRGASLAQVKQAYRRLAKTHHPDSAGERALPRFLEIQAAYEQLAGGANPAPGGRRGGGTPQGPAWQADATRAEATRRAYGTRTRRTTGRSARPDEDARTGERPDEPPRDRPPRGRRTRKATLGSTSYDEATEEPFEPDWTGASWYGTSSGTYWTINPREYADPRKHGPEYQARARRRAAQSDDGPDPEGIDAPPDGEPDDGPAETAPDEPAPAPGGTAPGGASTWRAAAETAAGSAWSAAAGAGGGPAGAAQPGERGRRSGAPPPASPGSTDGPSVEDVRRILLEGKPAGIAGRFALALAGGIPISLGIAWLLGELTGCGRFAATCQPEVVSSAWVGGLAIVALLALVPALAAMATVGTLVMLAVGVPASVFLSATGGARLPQASSAVLGVVLALGWLAGAGFAAARRVRRREGRGPVS